MMLVRLTEGLEIQVSLSMVAILRRHRLSQEHVVRLFESCA